MFPLWDNVYSWSFPWVTYLIILINCAAFAVNELSSNQLNVMYGYSVYDADINIKLITYQFLHANFIHIFSNMWFLHVFGNNVEDRIGHIKFLVFYLICGALAAIGQVIFMDTSVNAHIIGASGSVSGVLGAYFMLFPWAKIKTVILVGFFPLICSVPASIWLILWFAGQYFSAMIGLVLYSNVAFFAHLTGFLFGIVVGAFFRTFEPVRVRRII